MPRVIAQVAVIVVGFRNSTDITGCLRALSQARSDPSFDVFIAENGGTAAMDALVEALLGSPWCNEIAMASAVPIDTALIRRLRLFQLSGQTGQAGARIHVAEMSENLGYAGAINAWLRVLQDMSGWTGAWILNPDTEPSPTALAELVAYSQRRAKGMVGSRLVGSRHGEHIHSRGLAWRKFASKAWAVDYHSPATLDPDPDDVEARLDAPSGASCYVTRDLINKIGLMDERFFLYFEDLEWGCRAAAAGGVGYAHRSVVFHIGGTTIGQTRRRAGMSKLAVYLEFRNRILFVQQRYPGWLAWTVLMQFVHAATFGCVGALPNMLVALHGIKSGVIGETGRPDHIIEPKATQAPAPDSVKRRLKIAISCLYFLADRFLTRLAKLCGLGRGSRLVVLCYHSVPPQLRAGFDRQMKLLAGKARVVNADWDGTPPGSGRMVAITFDDAYVSVVEQALPILARHDFPCTIFVPSGSLGRRPDWHMEHNAAQDEVVVNAAALQRIYGPRVTIGAHSITHLHLTTVTHEVARAEIRGARQMLAHLLGRPVTLFAFPYGDFNLHLAELCRQEGFRHAFTISPIPVVASDKSVLRGRIGVDPTDGDLEFVLKISGAYAWLAYFSSLKRSLVSPWTHPAGLATPLPE